MEQSGWLDTHPCFVALGKTHYERHGCYEKFVRGVIPDGEWGLIRKSVQRGQLTGNDKFIDDVEKMIGRRIEHGASGNQPTKKTLKVSRP